MDENTSLEEDDNQLKEQVKELKKQIAQMERELRKSARFISHASAIMEAKTQLSRSLEAENIKQNKYMDMIVTNSPNALILLDGENRILLATRQFFKLASVENMGYVQGLPFDEVVCKTFNEKSSGILSDLVEKIAKTREPVEVTEWLEYGENREYYTVKGLPVREADTIIGVLIVFFELTELMNEKVKAEQANHAKSAFLAKMSHEIRTPMNAITGISELILREEISPIVREYAMDVKNAGTNLLSIINDILDFSKIESGKMEIVSAKYQLASLINDVIAIIRMRLVEKPVHLVVNVDCTLPNSMAGDEVRIRQILLNLMSNAVKYTNEGCIHLKVRGEKKNPDEVNLIFEIADTGIGIKEEDIGKLFGDFVQFDAEKNKNIEGTGLGLAITRKLCLAMGGDVTVVSRYGKGSTFTALIPQEVREYIPLATVEEAETKKVLIYKTVEACAASISESLDNLSVQNRIITNDDELLSALAEEKYQFIFIRSVIFDKVKGVLKKAKFKGTAVLLSEFGDLSLRKDVRSIALPAHSIAIANVLNNVEAAVNYNENKNNQIRFTAPNARILVVDDIATNLKVVEGLISPYDIQIVTCMSGKDAVYLVQENQYDLVFMDHMMPGMDGIEATAAIRQLEDEYYKKVPIIALTANAISGMKDMFLEKGFNDYLSKPIEISKLEEIMGKWIPKEKQIKVRETAAEKKTGGDAKTGNPRPSPFRLEIPGVDTTKGLAMTGGTETGYRKVLQSFYKDARERLPLLETVPSEEALPLFTIHVHALKSAAAIIGAAGLSTLAAELEAAGKAGDLETIERGLRVFHGDMQNLIENIGSVMDDFNGSVVYNEASRTEALKRCIPLFGELSSALEQMDIGVIHRVLTELEDMPLDAKTQEIINGVSNAVLMSEFEEAAALIAGLQAPFLKVSMMGQN
ncbi:hypothetical protein AGMMS49546_35660 [Spirochaetia bacterium]|nr:hypothetical protein AGMMS49546_35660 [Spirochaetia bacterium]